MYFNSSHIHHWNICDFARKDNFARLFHTSIYITANQTNFTMTGEKYLRDTSCQTHQLKTCIPLQKIIHDKKKLQYTGHNNLVGHKRERDYGLHNMNISVSICKTDIP